MPAPHVPSLEVTTPRGHIAQPAATELDVWHAVACLTSVIPPTDLPLCTWRYKP